MTSPSKPPTPLPKVKINLQRNCLERILAEKEKKIKTKRNRKIKSFHHSRILMKKLKKLIKAMSFFEHFVARGRFEAFAFLLQSRSLDLRFLKSRLQKWHSLLTLLWVSTRFLIERLKLSSSPLIEF